MFTKTFSQLSKQDTDIAGGKGASLGEMLNNGVQVPNGFVVLSTTFDKFLQATGLTETIAQILESINPQENAEIDSASEEIKKIIKQAERSCSSFSPVKIA